MLVAVEPVVAQPASIIANVALSIVASILAARDGLQLGRIPAGLFKNDSKMNSFCEKEGGRKRADRDSDRGLTKGGQIPADRERADYDQAAARDPAADEGEVPERFEHHPRGSWPLARGESAKSVSRGLMSGMPIRTYCTTWIVSWNGWRCVVACASCPVRPEPMPLAVVAAAAVSALTGGP